MGTLGTLSASAPYPWDTQKSWSCSTGGALRLSKLVGCGQIGGNPVEAIRRDLEEASCGEKLGFDLKKRRLGNTEE